LFQATLQYLLGNFTTEIKVMPMEHGIPANFDEGTKFKIMIDVANLDNEQSHNMDEYFQCVVCSLSEQGFILQYFGWAYRFINDPTADWYGLGKGIIRIDLSTKQPTTQQQNITWLVMPKQNVWVGASIEVYAPLNYPPDTPPGTWKDWINFNIEVAPLPQPPPPAQGYLIVDVFVDGQPFTTKVTASPTSGGVSYVLDTGESKLLPVGTYIVKATYNGTTKEASQVVQKDYTSHATITFGDPMAIEQYLQERPNRESYIIGVLAIIVPTAISIAYLEKKRRK
jgi:hypothetical protein